MRNRLDLVAVYVYRLTLKSQAVVLVNPLTDKYKGEFNFKGNLHLWFTNSNPYLLMWLIEFMNSPIQICFKKLGPLTSIDMMCCILPVKLKKSVWYRRLELCWCTVQTFPTLSHVIFMWWSVGIVNSIAKFS